MKASKVIFHPVHESQDMDALSIKVLGRRLEETYGMYQLARKRLNYAAITRCREMLSQIAMSVYRQSSSLGDSRIQMDVTFARIGDCLFDELDEYILGSHIYPVPGLDSKGKRTPSPTEAIITTIENLELALRITERLRPHTQSVLLSGAHAWGPFYDIRGKISEVLIGLGMEQRPPQSCSDLDFLVCVSDMSDAGEAISSLVAADICSEEELQRFSIFKELYDADVVDIFSINTYWKGVEGNVRFHHSDIIKGVADFALPFRDDGIHFLRDFRTNASHNDRGSGYKITDIKRGEHLFFKADPSKIQLTDTVKGLVMRRPVHGFISEGSNKRYFMGLTSFFLLIAPVVLHDQGNYLSDSIERLRQRVEAILEQAPPKFIVREERMPPWIRKRIGEYLAGTLRV